MCVYCATQLATTEDHVFARGFFVEARRDNLPKVPACQPCNQVKSGLEHYLATVLPFAGLHADAPANLQDMVPRTAMSQANACEFESSAGSMFLSAHPKQLAT